jgi:hypothetical protein
MGVLTVSGTEARRKETEECLKRIRVHIKASSLHIFFTLPLVLPPLGTVLRTNGVSLLLSLQ